MVMQTTTYETAKAAERLFHIEQEPKALAQNIQPVQDIGDEAYFGDPAALKNALVFRKGRVIIRVSYHNEAVRNLGAAQRIQALKPAAQAFIHTIKDF